MSSRRSGAPVTGALAAALALTAAIGLTTPSCHRPATSASAPESLATSASAASSEAPSDAEPLLAEPRCKRTEEALVLGAREAPSGGAEPDAAAAGPDPLDDLEIGDAIGYPGGYAVGLVHRTAVGRVGAVALLARAPLRLARIVDLGPTLGDAPPPRIGWRPPDIVAASYVRSPSPAAAGADATRDVALYAIAGDGAPPAPLVVPQQRDDSLALDLAAAGSAGLLVWDEATSAPATKPPAANSPRGVIKGALFAKDHASPARDLSPPDSDAELPRVAASGTGFVVVWIARRPEPSVFDGSESEATGEPRAYGWLEMVSVDEHANPTGPVRRLTQPAGHVSAFDLDVRGVRGGDPGSGPPVLVVVARDDGEAVDGSGGALLRVRVKGDTVEAPIAFETDGLGRGAPSFVSGFGLNGQGPLALAWIGQSEEARFLPLDASGSPVARPSGEDGLKDARPLGFLEGAFLEGSPPATAPAAPASASVLVATPSDPAAQLRVFVCAK